MLVIMTIDHLDLFGPVYRYTFETFGYVSAAEGFVLLSGIVAGLVYGRAADRGELFGRVRRRLFSLWRHQLVVVGALAGWWWWQATERPAASLVGAMVAAVGGALLLNQEPPLDILALYLVLVAALVPVLRITNRRGPMPVLALAAILWGLDQWLTLQSWYPATLDLRGRGVPLVWHPNHFHLLAWPLLFTAGVVGGHVGAGRLGRPARPWSLALALGLAVALACLRHGVVLPELSSAHLLTARGNLGLLRLFDVALVAWLLLQMGLRRPALLRQGWLELLGRHSLTVFVWHVLLQLFLRPHYLEAAARWGWSARVLILAAAVASLSLPAWIREQGRLRNST